MIEVLLLVAALSGKGGSIGSDSDPNSAASSGIMTPKDVT